MVCHKMKHFSSSESQAFLIFHFAETFKIPTSASLICSRSKFWTRSISLRWKLISSSPCGRMSACGGRASFVFLSVVGMTNSTRESESICVQVLIPPVCCHQGLFLANYCTVMSQRRKSAITFPYIILMSSHSNSDPSQSILTHEIWQAVPEVMQLFLGNRIVITGPVYLGFRGRFGSQAANSLIWAGIASGICLRACTSHSVFPLCTEHRRFSPPGFGDSHCPVLESWTVSFLRAFVFFPPAMWCCPWSFWWAPINSCRYFSIPTMGLAGVKGGVMKLAHRPQVL